MFYKEKDAYLLLQKMKMAKFGKFSEANAKSIYLW